MIDIIPAILPRQYEELENGLAYLQGVSSLVQIDLVGSNVFEGREAPPLWEKFDFEFDVMLPNPRAEVERCVQLGASRIVVHANAIDALEAVQWLQSYRNGDFPIQIGVALSSTDTPDVLDTFEGLYDYVQVMGIAHIGKQGEPFDARAIDTVERLRAAYPNLMIQVDGAAATHPRELAEAGANRLIVGSAIINAADPKDVLKSLYNKANASQ